VVKRRSRLNGVGGASKRRAARAEQDPAQAVETLLSLIVGTQVADIEVRWDGGRVRVTRDPSAPGADPRRGFGHEELVERASATSGDVPVTSNYVGMFHQQPEAAFPSLGDYVKKGQTVAHVETLRIQNTVVASADGAIIEVLVADGTPVEYGQPLLVIRRGEPTASGEPEG